MFAHLDLDEFFVAVERLHDPSLAGKPVVVGGNPQGRGVVACAGYGARKFGIHSAMPMKEAIRRCPDLVIVANPKGNYSYYSGIVKEILEHYIPVVHQASVDEFYLDCQGLERIRPNIPDFLADLRLDLLRIMNLPLSIGVGTAPYLAKMASKHAKPCGFYFIRPGEERDFLFPRPVRDLPGVGPKMNERLNRLGIHTIAQLAAMDRGLIQRVFGVNGLSLLNKANGRPVKSTHLGFGPMTGDAQKQMSVETTFPTDIDDVKALRLELRRLVEKLAYRLRSEQLAAKCITLKIRYSDFITKSKSCSVELTDIDFDITSTCLRLFEQLNTRRVRIRLLGVSLSKLQHGGHLALPFDERARKKRLIEAADRIRSRYKNRHLIKIGTFGSSS